MRLLAITPIFPNRVEPQYGPFNRQQFKALAAHGADLRVLCSVPYVPGASLVRIPPRAAKLSALGRRDTMDGMDTTYLRRLYVPTVGLAVALPLYLASLAPHRALVRWADVVLGTWAYPDGCASILAAHAAGKPCAVKVHGSDVNIIAKRRAARAVLERVLPRADALITVSHAMGDELAKMGVPRSRIHFVPNGVDRSLFGAAGDRAFERRVLDLPNDGPIILFVGRIEPQKGMAELLEAFERVHAQRPDVTLALIGDGVWRKRAENLRARFGNRLVVAGALPLPEVAKWMTACDVFTLPSHAEGTPNVILEALASGRPVVATSIGGIPDVLENPKSGILVPPRDASALARALLDALARKWDPAEVRACGPVSWDESAAALYAILESL
jgi:glycosyltransferase involved in cell wall biosynthesis